MSQYDAAISVSRSECRICGKHNLSTFETREMMFGTREQFLYQECHFCGCVQIAAYPDDIGRFYPPNYYSFDDGSSAAPAPRRSLPGRMLDYAKLQLITSSSMAKRRFWGSDETREWLKSRVASLYVKYVPDPSSRILDVGCGSGVLLRDLYHLYYRNINGVDPFIESDIQFAGQTLVRKTSLSSLKPSYDCISFHHVFEHMPDQIGVLTETRRLLAPGGIVMIRIPVVGGLAWRTYQENWVQLDPPRHYYLHSERSFTYLAGQVGFDVASIEYDSTGFQFWGSELYSHDIALKEPGSPAIVGPSIFSSEQLTEFDRQAAELNLSRDGDQFVVILRRKDPA